MHDRPAQEHLSPEPSPTPSGRTPLTALVAEADWRFFALGGGARLPTAMLPLGTLLYVAERAGSYATGGLAVAVLSLGGGVGGPLVGLASDRLGQRRVALLATAIQVGALSALLLLGTSDLALALPLVAVVGVANPQAGAMARSRWGVIGRGRPDRRSFVSTAMAYESAVDESSFVVGPALVGTTAGLLSPTAGLLLTLVLAALTQTGFAVHRSALAGRGGVRRHAERSRGSLPVLHLVCLLAAMGAVGVVFGAVQTGVAARMSLGGTGGLTGPVYAAMGVGSAVTGLLTTRFPRRFGLEARIVAGGAVLLLGGVAAAAAHEPLPLALACLLIGIGVAPALVSSYALAERSAPSAWATTAMTSLATANVVGVAAGAALAGLLVDRVSPGAALLVTCAAGTLVLVSGAVARLTRPHG